MALGTSNITTAAVNTELSSPYTTPRLVSNLCKHANAGNIASFLGPGTLAVDASKNVYWVAPTNNYKLGDFRGYNASASAPAAADDFTHYWGPTGTTTDIEIATLPQQMNLFFIDSLATKIYYKAYTSAANRAAETSLYDSNLANVLTSAVTPLTGHTRQQTTKPQHPHVQTWTGFNVSGFGATTYIYMDTFFANTGGSRLVNLGNAVANGYTTITLKKNQYPKINATGNCVGRTGYTGTWTSISNSSVQCSSAEQTMTVGSYSYSFYLTAVGFQTINYNIYPTSCNVVMYTYDGTGSLKDTTTIGTGISLNATTAKSFSGTKAVAWAYNDYAIVSVTSVSSWGTASAC